MVDKIEITASEILDMPQNDFESLIKDNRVSIGDASNLVFFMKSVYQRTVFQKDALVEAISKGTVENSEESEKCLKDTYLLLLDIENKVTFLTSYIDEVMKS